MAPLPIYHGGSTTGRVTMSPSPSRMPPSPKGSGVARDTCSHGTPILVVSSPSSPLAARCTFIPCQLWAAALPVSSPAAPAPLRVLPPRRAFLGQDLLFQGAAEGKPSCPHEGCLPGDFHPWHPFPSFSQPGRRAATREGLARLPGHGCAERAAPASPARVKAGSGLACGRG